MASTLRCNHDIKFIPGERGFLGLVYYITDYATKLSKPLYHTFSIAAGLKSESRDEGRHLSMEEEEDSNRSRRFLIRLYNKMSTSRELSGPEIANVMIGQPESYTNVRFTMLSYNSLYLEMVEMFPNLKVDSPEQNDHQVSTVSIIDSRTVTDHFADYRYRGPILRDLCLYDYSSVVYTTPISGISIGEKDEEGWVRFSENHPLYERLAQRIYRSAKDCRVIGFSGQKPQKSTEVAGERYVLDV